MDVQSSKDPSPDALKALEFPEVLRSARDAAKSDSYSQAEAYFIEALRRGREHGLVPVLELAQVQIEYALLRARQEGISASGLISIAKLLSLQAQSLEESALTAKTPDEREQLFEAVIEIALLQVDVLNRGEKRDGICLIISDLYRKGELFPEHAALALSAICILEAEDDVRYGGFSRALTLESEAHTYLVDERKSVTELRKKLAARLLRLRYIALIGMLDAIETMKNELRKEKFQLPHRGLLGTEPYYRAKDVAQEIESRGVAAEFLKVFNRHPGDTLCRGGIVLALSGAEAEIKDKAFERDEALSGLLGDS